MFKDLGFIYGPAFSRTIVYMLQAVEYRPSVYIKWLWRADSLSKISYRKELVSTRPAKMLLAILRAGILAEIIASVVSLIYGVGSQNYAEISYSVVLLLFAPIIWAHLIIIPLLLGDFVAMRPRYGLKIQQASRTFDRHPGTKIAIAGSYGKTTMKEILLAVLSEGKNVKATPANRNVSISHAQFAEKLHGDEDILIIEYGEGAPGDVSRFAKKTHPSVGVITGLAPAHLDRYKTLENAGRDIFSLAGYLNNKDVYVNGESKEAQGFIKKTYEVFSSHGIADWKVKEVKNSIFGP